MEGYMGYPPRPDWMYPIGSYVQRGAGCHDNGDHDLYEAPRHTLEVVLEVVVFATAHRACS
eukprot:3429830-Pleurochrysis_carterae.AAC.1